MSDDKLAAENVVLRATLEEVRGLSSTCGYDYGNSRIHKLALEALDATPETTKVQAVLEAADAETQAEAECMSLLREAEQGHPLRRVVRVNRARQSVEEARQHRREATRALRGAAEAPTQPGPVRIGDAVGAGGQSP